MMCLAGVLGLGGAALGILGGAGDFGVLLAHPSPASTFVAMGDSIFGIDPLSAFFLVPVFLMGGLGALYATGYRPAQRHPRTSRRSLLFWGTLVAGLAILLIARNALAFLLGWEAMALSAFFLITLDDAGEETRGAGLVYLVATHVGTLLLFCLFAYWRQVTGSFDLLPASRGLIDPQAANLLFLLAFLAFGLKAGMMPLHFWLPGAHAAAPSHVSAMLSGVVLKMGIYGLMRFVLLLPDPPLLWGESIIAFGAVSSLLGVAFAIAQHDLKRLLAYQSVENIGIILMGFGVALVGQSLGRPGLTGLGMGAALLHVWNHSVFKSLLFFAAGSVVDRTGTRSIDRLGGLSRIMPWTAAFFLAGAVAISGLPPLNGFVSEFLVYVGAFRGSLAAGGGSVVPLVVIPVLAATGALALGCFVKVYGAVFLGAPRSKVRPSGGESASSMLLPMAVLSGICVLIGALPLLASRILDPVLRFWCLSTGQGFTALSELAPLSELGDVSGLFVLILIPLLLILMVLSRRGAVPASVGTWDCGYAAPGARMQYTASSFGRSIVSMFAWILRTRIEAPEVNGAFPKPTSMESHVDDATLDRVIMPLSRALSLRAGRLRRFQQGLTQNYLLYILIAVLVLLGTTIPFGELLNSVLAR